MYSFVQAFKLRWKSPYAWKVWKVPLNLCLQKCQNISRDIPWKVSRGWRIQWGRGFLWHKSADWLWNANLPNNSMTPFINKIFQTSITKYSELIQPNSIIVCQNTNWNIKISINLPLLLFVLICKKKCDVRAKTVFVRLTARSCRYYCSISCQPRNKVIKHCFTRHKDALFFFINSLSLWKEQNITRI